MTCPACGSDSLLELLDVGELPVLCNQLCASEQAARDVMFGAVSLSFCQDCGHLFNRLFDGSKVHYSPDYENSLHCSGEFQRYAATLVRQLIQRHRLRGKRIVEIGCGQGDFLRALCEAGGNVGFGFDPSYAGGEMDPRVTIRKVSFAEVDDMSEADFVYCRHVLEHIEQPRRFLEALVSKLRPGTSVFFEVPNVLFTIRDLGIWDVIYEHCGYFSPSSLARAFELSGMRVHDVEDTFGGQFLVIHAEVGPGASAALSSDPEWIERVAGFSEKYREKVAHWRRALSDANAQTRRTVVWGAGSKGNTFLNTVGRNASAVVDINPRKQGKFVAGTGHPIVAPKELCKSPPSAVVIMNPIYRSEIEGSLKAFGLEPRLLVA